MIEKIRFTGHSMWPTLKTGDVLWVELLNEKTLDRFAVGQILLVRGPGEWYAHRVVESHGQLRLKGDRALFFDDPADHSVWGQVIGYERTDRGPVVWGSGAQLLGGWIAWSSARSARSGGHDPRSRIRRQFFLAVAIALGFVSNSAARLMTRKPCLAG